MISIKSAARATIVWIYNLAYLLCVHSKAAGNGENRRLCLSRTKEVQTRWQRVRNVFGSTKKAYAPRKCAQAAFLWRWNRKQRAVPMRYLKWNGSLALRSPSYSASDMRSASGNVCAAGATTTVIEPGATVARRVHSKAAGKKVKPAALPLCPVPKFVGAVEPEMQETGSDYTRASSHLDPSQSSLFHCFGVGRFW